MLQLSAVILTKNEEKNIENCIKSLSFCDEVIVIDDYSSDKTVEIAKKMKAKVFVRALDNDFSAQRNFGLEKANGRWVLFIDADEKVPDALASEIINYQLSTINYNGFYIKRRDIIWGKELNYGETGNIKLLRLAKKSAGVWVGKVHERWIIKGKTGQLQHSLLHYPHQTIGEFLEEVNFYTTLRAQELYEKRVETYWWSIILYPKIKFFINYFVRRGFLDGIHGFIFAMIMSFHSFLVRGKLYFLWKKQ